mmetsp:Transcript_50822/g.80968  ORF Transcript_50822/g.80968 Transcript_50822/m.80968 type:complete len:132 (-) Transcript_50822:211-606(-)
MGNSNSEQTTDTQTDDNDTDDERTSDDEIVSSNFKKGIIEQEKATEETGGGGLASGVKSVFGGIKSYFTGPSQSEIEKLDKYENRYTKRAVFVQLAAPNYHFANQGLQWVKDTMQYDEEGDGYHISVGPLS